MATLSIHSLHWPSANSVVIENHSKVFKNFGLSVNYCHEEIPHGYWMTDILNKSTTDLVLFVDSDCVPLFKDTVFKVVSLAARLRSFVGPAQATNCIPNRYHVYAAPSFLAIWRQAWVDLGKPALTESNNADVGQSLSIAAERSNLPYVALYPVGFESTPIDGVWRLGNYGYFGIGTYYRLGIYHLFQGRLSENVIRFVSTCERSIAGSPFVVDLISSVDLSQVRLPISSQSGPFNTSELHSSEESLIK
jgi:hypothetical protein